VILGIRPEHFEDARLVGDKPGATFDTELDLVESMGSDIFAYFTLKGESARSEELDELAADTGQDMAAMGTSMTARLDAGARVGAGAPAKLWYDTSKIAVFDAETGHNLVEREAEPATA
jgi:multiple sugar transport system ATP-binding protein